MHSTNNLGSGSGSGSGRSPKGGRILAKSKYQTESYYLHLHSCYEDYFESLESRSLSIQLVSLLIKSNPLTSKQ